MLSRRFCFLLYLVAGLLQVHCTHAQISKGHQILINRGLQLQGLVTPDNWFHPDTYSNANYTTVGFSWNSTGNLGPPSTFLGPPPGSPWGRWVSDGTNMPGMGYGQTGNGDTFSRTNEIPYLSQLVGIQLGDEWNLDDAATRTRLVNWFNAVRSNWPNAILYHNNWGSQINCDCNLADFITRAQPDMLCFDTYPWQSVYDTGQPNNTGPAIPGPPTDWYRWLRRYREFARGAGIPLSIYRQTFHAVQDYNSTVYRDPSPSELRLNTFAALAFNTKYFSDFTYNSGAGSLFTNLCCGSGDTQTNANGLYAEMTDVNKRGRNFGKALVRLAAITNDASLGYTSSILFIRGKDSSGSLTPVPVGFLADSVNTNYTTWTYQRNDPYLTNNWVVTNKGTKNNGYPGDVIIAWFKVLDESFDGPDYTNEIYMMVVNGLTDPTGTAADCRQEIKLNFQDAFLALEVINPTNGLVDVQPLPLTNGFRQLTLNLNGGDAALFKFSDGAPFVGVQLTGPPAITAQPRDAATVFGANATFSARAAGGSPLTYRWRMNGAPINGATTNTYTRTNVQSGDLGSYTMVASNGFGSVTSAPALLSLAAQPAIQTQPQSRTNFGGTMAIFHVQASGGSLTYQWRRAGANLFDGGTLSGTGTDTLAISAVTRMDAADYTVVITNAAGSITSAPATLTVIYTPILYEPFDYTSIGGPVSSNTPANWSYGGTGANDLSVVSGSLSYAGLAAPVGNSVTNGGVGLGVRRLFGTNLSSGSVYFSALFRINDLGYGIWTGVAGQVGALTDTNGSNFRLQVMVKSNSPAGYVFGLQKGGTGAGTTFDTTEYHANDTVFLVGKYDFDASPNTVYLWINPSPATFLQASAPSSGVISTNSGSDGFVIDRFNMRQNTGASVPASMQWDELRIGRSWAEVTPPGPILFPTRLSNLERLSDGRFQFDYTNGSAVAGTIYASTNLSSWSAIGSATQIAPGQYRFTDAAATNFTRRFYQLRTP